MESEILNWFTVDRLLIWGAIGLCLALMGWFNLSKEERVYGFGFLLVTASVVIFWPFIVVAALLSPRKK